MLNEHLAKRIETKDAGKEKKKGKGKERDAGKVAKAANAAGGNVKGKNATKDARKKTGKASTTVDGKEAGEASTAAAKDEKVLRLKRGPKKFVEAMELLNEDQMAAVVEMGFGSLVHFKVTAIPGKLAYEILEHFDQDACGVEYQRGILHLCEEDVQATFGVPKGTTRIIRNGHQKNHKFVDDLAHSANKTRKNMGPKYLIEKMLSDTEGGELFRKVFLILFDTCLIAPSGDGYCHTQIIECIEDIACVRDYNWCGYVLDTLLGAHKNWVKDKTKAFSGPISFLLPCYVDRVVLKSRLVARSFPTIKGWTTKLLNKREKMELVPGPFGRGMEEPIFDPLKSKSMVEADKLCIGSSSGFKSRDYVGTGVAKGRRALVTAMGKAADAIDELMKRMEEVSEDVKNDGCSQIAAKSALKMIGVHEMEPEKDVHQVESMSQAMEEDELDNPEFLDALEKVMRVAEQRKRWETNGPSFDLGFDFGGKNVS